MIVGLTGGIGTGKSTVIKLFQKFENVAIYIADDAAKKLTDTSPLIKEQLISEFGNKAYIENALNRTYIADIVFNDAKKLTYLNSVIHPEVSKHFQKFIFKNKHKDYILYESAILFESGNYKNCDFVIAVTAPLETCISRVIKRDRVTRAHVLSRINNQWLSSKKSIQSHYIIENITLEETQKKVHNIHNILTKKNL